MGKFAARVDDLLNFIPARLATLLMILATLITKKNTLAAIKVMLQDHSKTESPNAGWTMSAVAGALGVELEKVGHYKLGTGGASPSQGTIIAALQIALATSTLWISICIAVQGVRFVLAS